MHPLLGGTVFSLGPCAGSFAYRFFLFVVPEPDVFLVRPTPCVPRPTSQDLPNDVFEVMQRGNQESAGAVRHASPSVQEFEWTGQEAKADFKVGVRRGATLGSVLCGAQIIEGSTVTRLSFCVEVVESGRGIAGLWGAEVQELETNMEPVQTDVARIDHEELEIKDKLGEGIQVRDQGAES